MSYVLISSGLAYRELTGPPIWNRSALFLHFDESTRRKRWLL